MIQNKYLIYGCMFSGKTSKLKSLIKYCKLPYVVFVHHFQNKFTTHDISTIQMSGRDYISQASSLQNNVLEKGARDYIVTPMENIYEFMCEKAKNAKVWFVDEIQFYEPELVEKLLRRPEIMYFAGLDTDFNGNAFPTTKMLIGTVESTRLKAICECGMPAIHSKLTINKPEGNILIGDDFYVPSCANCFLKNN